MQSISRDGVHWMFLLYNLTVVYAWTGERELAFQELAILLRPQVYVHHGDFKTKYAWDPLRTDPRFAKLLAQLAPKE
jgi:hypothetical protein